MTYNGWKNRATWNVALWISNDAYLAAEAACSHCYSDLVDTLRDMDITETPDKVAYNDTGLDIPRLDDLIKELGQ